MIIQKLGCFLLNFLWMELLCLGVKWDFRGFLFCWNPNVGYFSPFSIGGCILLEGTIRGFNYPAKIFIVYNPYFDKQLFWDGLLSFGILNDPSLILEGDLNLTVLVNEVWGQRAKSNPLAIFFQ